jgi:hypothetical protein
MRAHQRWLARVRGRRRAVRPPFTDGEPTRWSTEGGGSTCGTGKGRGKSRVWSGGEERCGEGGGGGSKVGPGWWLHGRQGRGKRRGSGWGEGEEGHRVELEKEGGQAADSGVGAAVGGVVHEQGRALGPIREEGSGRVGRCFGPVQNELGIFYLLNIFFTNSKFKCFKECLPLVEKFQIKCGFIRN